MTNDKKAEYAMKMYEKAIEGYQQHWEHYTRWMNHFAIFTGALFVGYYTVSGNAFLQLMILLVGCISSWFWLFSARGFYRWLVSWINTVLAHEKSIIKEIFPNADPSEICVYSIFIKGKDEKLFETRPFSTQKITQWFAGSVAVVWSAIMLVFLLQRYSELGCLTVAISIILLLSLIIACGCWLCRESDLGKTHKPA